MNHKVVYLTANCTTPNYPEFIAEERFPETKAGLRVALAADPS
jgi:hypothetical protein